MDDTATITQRVADRREQLRKYRAVFAETYGHAIDPDQHEATDGLLRTLLEQPDPPAGVRVMIEGPGLPAQVQALAGHTGVLLSTGQGYGNVKLDRIVGIYTIPTECLRVTS